MPTWITLDSVRMKTGAVFSVLGTGTSLPATIPPGVSLPIHLRVLPIASEQLYRDTLLVFTDCQVRNIPVSVSTVKLSFADDMYQQLTLRIAPNPSRDYVEITSTDKLIRSIVIYDVLGNECMRRRLLQNEVARVETVSLPNGVYTVSALSTTGSIRNRRRLVVHR